MIFDTFFDIVNLIVAIILLVITVRSSRSLMGSFFKKYYRWIVLGTTALMLGFLFEIFGDTLGWPETLIQTGHHTSLIIFEVIFVFAAGILPKEAAEYLKDKNLNDK